MNSEATLTQKAQKVMFISWVPYQRRTQSLADQMGIDLHYYHYKWEVKSKVHKLFSYFVKFLHGLYDMFRLRPRLVFMQLAPTPVLYVTVIYCALTGAKYVADCHNTMIHDSHWLRWPLAAWLIRRSKLVIVHNADVQTMAEQDENIPSIVLRDPMPNIEVDPAIQEVAGIRIQEEEYMICPCSFDVDEPLDELFDAVRENPDIRMAATWYYERLPQEVRERAPDNMIFTGFLPEEEFNALYANATAAVVLTTREGTQPSGATEAISMNVPLIVSDIKTTRRLYDGYAIFVDNKPTQIGMGMRTALNENDAYRQKMLELKLRFQREINAQMDSVRNLLDI